MRTKDPIREMIRLDVSIQFLLTPNGPAACGTNQSLRLQDVSSTRKVCCYLDSYCGHSIRSTTINRSFGGRFLPWLIKIFSLETQDDETRSRFIGRSRFRSVCHYYSCNGNSGLGLSRF